ncbi:ATP-binding protein [Flavobacterium taihuense]|uniref:histidine kinase n=1 Tax=Flavobacterium taihuense TaxID=2857508 RepID=A0ABS6XTT6_9FLAO|nr:ATP-binding protein [Flavobacterium taihuense]MBW4360089.1 response regulator [Flavobacterium taihuense]
MKKSPITNTYPKILFLILSSSVFFILLYISLFFYTKQVENNVYRQSDEQYSKEVKKLFNYNSQSIITALNIDSFWDDFVSFFSTKNKKWYDENIASELLIHNGDYSAVYGTDKKILYSTSTDGFKSNNFIPKEALTALEKSKVIRFYMPVKEGILEVFGSTVHPTNDPSKNKSKTSGYYFITRLLNKKFISQLEKLTDSEIDINKTNTFQPKSKNELQTIIILKNYNNDVVSTLGFKRPFAIYFEKIITVFYLIIFVFAVNLILTLFYTKKWVFYPLNLIATVLQTGNKKSIKDLKKTSNEFGHIAELFEINEKQKNELIKEKLKAEENDKLKSSFLSNLSHEIRTPMNAIVGFTELLMNTEVGKEEQIEYLSVVDKSGKNLIAIIDDLIEMSKIESHQTKPNYSAVNIETCIHDLYESIQITTKKVKKIDFKIIESQKPAQHPIKTDEVKLKQIITNLVTNALKFTEQGAVSFGYEIDEQNQHIRFKVKDTGLGIEKNNQQYIFDRFRRVGGDHTIKIGGLGLGLAISKAYVEMLGGTISLESQLGKGSEFYFTIPLEYIKTLKITVQPVNQKTIDKGDEEGTLLIAEDDNINFLLFQKIMKSKNYKIIRAVNGQEAVNICLENPNIDLVLMDIKMPIMDGFEALEKIAPIRPNLPIIAQTAFSSNEDKERIFKAGFTDYITKPINRERLYELIDDILKNKKH